MQDAHEYTIFGCTLLSNVPIPELPEAASRESNGRLKLVVDYDGELNWVETWTPLWVDDAKVVWLEVYIESKQRYSLRFPNIASFVVDAQPDVQIDASIKCYPCTGVPDFTIRHIVLDQVIPLVLSYYDRILMHMAVVKIDDVGIGFMGKSGQGKSTLTAAFSRHGHVAVSDDTVLLKCEDQCYSAISNYPGVRLWGDSHEQLLHETEYFTTAHYSTKRRVVVDDLSFSQKPVPLVAFFALQEPCKDAPDEIRISRLSYPNATTKMIECKYRLEERNKTSMKKEFAAVSKLAATIPCFGVEYPRNYSFINRVRETLIAETLQVIQSLERVQQGKSTQQQAHS